MIKLVKKYSVERSKELFEKTKRIVPRGVSSGIRGPAFGIMPGVYPMLMERGNGSKLYDVDGNEYIDYILGYGPVILGHAHPKVNEAVREQLEKGTLFGLTTELEYKVAEKIVKDVPCADMVQFLTTGSDAVNLALRIARAYTGKEKIARFEFGYHGTHDWAEVGVSRGSGINYQKTLVSAGIPKSVLNDVIIMPWNDVETVEKVVTRHEHELAAVICEPVAPTPKGDVMVEPEKGFLKELRHFTVEHDVLLIFDEVKSGFRLALGGAQEYYGVIPDLATFSKALANGFPLSVVAGKREIMEFLNSPEGYVVIAGTFNANPICMAAALATLTELEKKGTIKRLHELGQMLQNGIKDAIEDINIEAIVQGVPPYFTPVFTELEKITNAQEYKTVDKYSHRRRKEIFARELVKRGILNHPNHMWYISTAHTNEDITKTIEMVYEALKEAKSAVTL